MKSFFFLFLSILFFSCEANKPNKERLAVINGENIYAADIDETIQGELYESLYNIYYSRKIALDEIIAEKLLSLESKQSGIRKDSLINSYINARNNNQVLGEFIKKHELHKGILDENNYMRKISIKSKEGRKKLDLIFKDHLKKEYINILKSKYKTDLFLSPPLPPQKQFDGIAFQSTGNKKAGSHIWLFADYDCSNCQNFYPVFKTLLEKYKNNLEFRYTHATNVITESILYAEYAADHNKFWQVSDSIYTNRNNKDFSLVTLSKILNLDYSDYKARSKDKATELEANLKKMSAITITPTLVINGRVYYGEISLAKIEEYLNQNVFL